jgi:hypothetical protein
MKKKVEVLEKSIFSRGYTFDNSGKLMEVKNRIQPKKGILEARMKYSM